MLCTIKNKFKLLFLSLSLLCHISMIWCDAQKSDEIACVTNETNISSTNNSFWRTIQADMRMVVMQLTSNHIHLFQKKVPALGRYITPLYQEGPRLIITNIFPDSQLSQINSIHANDTLNEINGETVHTLDDFKRAMTKSLQTGCFIIKATDESSLLTDNILVALPLENICKETVQLSRVYRYPLSPAVTQLVEQVLN
jgi:hypothetical protein